MNVPDNLKFTKSHEWVRVEGEEAYLGITDHAQSQLGDVVFVDVDTEGENLEKGETLGTIEAVKTVSDIFMPITGEILEFNEALQDNAEIINSDPYGEGWIVKMKVVNASELDELLSPEDYKNLIAH
ncbi:MAG: glycine cleavage system protein H [Bacteroidetes bacterium]|nr:MAG: glycine cleavage system protein H [Bacteroidota bacterium]